MLPRLTRIALFAVLSLASECLAGGASDDARRPNILFLFADDQRPDTVAALGNDHIDTQNLDRLAAEGFAFSGNHCMGSRHGAVCQPSRAMLMSGRTLHRVRDDLAGVTTLGEVLGGAGYRTFATGKWHNGRESFRRTFQRGRAILFGGMSDHFAVPLTDMTADRAGFENERTGRGHSSELFTDAAMDFLSEQGETASDEPFFCYVAFTAPHDPRDPPGAWRARYAEDRPPLPPNVLSQHPWSFDLASLTLRDEVLAGWPRDREVLSDQLAEYYGLISHLDEQVGRLLDSLDDLGLAEDTLVVYTADHGLAMGSHGLLGKQNLYEHSMGSPLILRGPSIPAGGRSDALVYLLDLFPTLCGVAGAELPEAVEGLDLMPIVSGERSSVRDSLFTLYRDNQRAVRDERWKLIRFPKIDVTLLFDLANDPHELHDLASDPDHAGQVLRLTTLLTDWQARTDDDCAWTAAELQPAQVDLSGRARVPDRHQPDWIKAKYFGL